MIDNANSFQDIHLTADLVRGRAGEGGPIGGAVAAVRAGLTEERHGLRRLVAGRRAIAAESMQLVIEAPTWRLTREVGSGSGSETAAALFAAEVNSAARRTAQTWWPLAG